ncbi:hypothetical protein CL622_08465 [archaeon]|nr:hypothetical protein [archaeon]|tara:strand:- start:601 stop:984 length:384 start_codon:yes stop_codon:yes gene_type:complete
MDLALCILIAIVLVAFALLIVVSGVSFKFNVSKEGFQGQVQARPASLKTPAPLPALPVDNAMTNIVPDVKDMAMGDRKFLFHSSACTPECCTNGRGNYSCSTGCVCVNDDQLSMLTNRGGNHTQPCQ